MVLAPFVTSKLNRNFEKSFKCISTSLIPRPYVYHEERGGLELVHTACACVWYPWQHITGLWTDVGYRWGIWLSLYGLGLRFNCCGVHYLEYVPAYTCVCSYSARTCAARGKVIEFVFLSFCKKNFEMAWTSHFQDFWAYHQVWKCSYLTYLYLPLGWLIPTLWDFCCFLIIRSTLSAILFTATSHAHKLYAMCSTFIYVTFDIHAHS